MGNAHSKPLAYRSYSCIQTTQNGESHFAQFSMVQKTVARAQEHGATVSSHYKAIKVSAKNTATQPVTATTVRFFVFKEIRIAAARPIAAAVTLPPVA